MNLCETCAEMTTASENGFKTSRRLRLIARHYDSLRPLPGCLWRWHSVARTESIRLDLLERCM